MAQVETIPVNLDTEMGKGRLFTTENYICIHRGKP